MNGPTVEGLRAQAAAIMAGHMPGPCEGSALFLPPLRVFLAFDPTLPTERVIDTAIDLEVAEERERLRQRGQHPRIGALETIARQRVGFWIASQIHEPEPFDPVRLTRWRPSGMLAACIGEAVRRAGGAA